MVSVCLPSHALLQHLQSYLGFSYLGSGVSLNGCSSKAQMLLLTLDERYLLTTAPPDFEHGIAPLGPPAPTQPLLLGPKLLVMPIPSQAFISQRQGTVLDIMVIRVNFTHSSPIQFADSRNVYVHSSNLLFDHFQFDGRCCERASEGRHIETIITEN